jgi:ABC-2 type transport system ATP-binding protein
MYEADELCRRVAVIAGGRIVAEGTPAELKARVLDRTIIEIESFGALGSGLDRLRALPGVISVSTEPREQAEVILVQSSVGSELTHALLRELQGITLGKVIAREPTLEDAYVELVQAA